MRKSQPSNNAALTKALNDYKENLPPAKNYEQQDTVTRHTSGSGLQRSTMTSIVSTGQSNPFDVNEKDLKANDVDNSLTVIDVQAGKHCSAALLEPERPSGLSNQRISDPFSEGSIADRVKRR